MFVVVAAHQARCSLNVKYSGSGQLQELLRRSVGFHRSVFLAQMPSFVGGVPGLVRSSSRYRKDDLDPRNRSGRMYESTCTVTYCAIWDSIRSPMAKGQGTELLQGLLMGQYAILWQKTRDVLFVFSKG